MNRHDHWGNYMIKAQNDNVFIERLPMEKTHLGMEVAEKACVKNHIGVVKFIESDKYVTSGDEVLIPHYNVTDVTVDGIEYAVAKGCDLFAIRKGDTYLPINRNVLVQKCVNDHIRDEDGEIALHMTENHIEFTEWVEVVDVAKDCKSMCDRYKGMFCVAPENDQALARIGYTSMFCLHEDSIQFVTTGD
jgi:co-chaperonin GroES (HSP10)